jgi:hypothetical protein
MHSSLRVVNLSSTENLPYNADGHDVPGHSHDGVAIYGPEAELRQRCRTDRKDQTRCENNSVGKSIGASRGPKEGKCDLDFGWHDSADEMITVVSCANALGQS